MFELLPLGSSDTGHGGGRDTPSPTPKGVLDAMTHEADASLQDFEALMAAQAQASGDELLNDPSTDWDDGSTDAIDASFAAGEMRAHAGAGQHRKSMGVNGKALFQKLGGLGRQTIQSMNLSEDSAAVESAEIRLKTVFAKSSPTVEPGRSGPVPVDDASLAAFDAAKMRVPVATAAPFMALNHEDASGAMMAAQRLTQVATATLGPTGSGMTGANTNGLNTEDAAFPATQPMTVSASLGPRRDDAGGPYAYADAGMSGGLPNTSHGPSTDQLSHVSRNPFKKAYWNLLALLRIKSIKRASTLSPVSTSESFLRSYTPKEDGGSPEGAMMAAFRKSRMSGDSLMSESSFHLQKKVLPLVGRLPIRSQYTLVGSLLIFSMTGIATGAVMVQYAGGQKTKAQQIAIKILGDVQKFDNGFSSVLMGRSGAVDATMETWLTMVKNFERLKTFNARFGSDASLLVHEIQGRLEQNLGLVDRHIQEIKRQKDFLSTASARNAMFQQEMGRLNVLIDRFSAVQMQLGSPDISAAFALKERLQGVQSHLGALLLSERLVPEQIHAMEQARLDFRGILDEMNRDTQSKNLEAFSLSGKKLTASWLKVSDLMDQSLAHADEMLSLRAMAPKLASLDAVLDQDFQAMLKVYEGHSFSLESWGIGVMIASLLAVIGSLLALFGVYSTENYNKALLDKIENSRNYSSVLRLLQEMAPLSDGDLTKKATVTDEITGAIADNINITIDYLSALVRQIKDTSLVMGKKTRELNLIAETMLRSSEDQSAAIAETGGSVMDVSQNIRDVSVKTQRSAKTAQESVNMSFEGSSQIRQSIESLGKIGNSIASTEKLMGKVSSSSRQISEVVDLLSDITQETNILALNATVQAGKAGEAGRGLQVVADSIQQLANKAAEATRRVGALIGAVQTDVNTVEDAVRKASTDISEGSRMSESAGKALAQIQESSNELLRIIQGISLDARKNAEVSDQISTSMNTLMRATDDSKRATQATANLIAEIADFSHQLGHSVQSFKVD